jgi:hypothetical protein
MNKKQAQLRTIGITLAMVQSAVNEQLKQIGIELLEPLVLAVKEEEVRKLVAKTIRQSDAWEREHATK